MGEQLTHGTEHYSKNNLTWYVGLDGWIGGKFSVSNSSTGYHGIMKQWWEYYCPVPMPRVLLISESNTVKREFEAHYPNWKISTLDYYPELNPALEKPDVVGDLCAKVSPMEDATYDLIINQATLEHLYNPYQAMANMFAALKPGGIIVSHTHPPGFEYHRYPSDYFRFMKDWWYDLPKYETEMELLELYMHDNRHVFTCYKK